MNRARFLRLLLASAAGLGLPASAAGQAAKPVAGRLRVAFQKGSVSLAVLKQRGALEAALPGVAVSWIEFPAGPQLLEALALDAADFGSVGDSPPIFAQAAGKELLYVANEPPKPDSSAILVRAESPIRSLGGLKGKRIAFQRGSSAHFLTVRALDKAGIAYQDFQPIHLPPAEARAAFDRGSVDAWAIWDPYFAAAELQGGARVLATGRELVSNNSFYLASRPFVARNSALLLAALDVLSQNEFYLRDKRKEAIALYSGFSGLEAPVVARLLDRRPASKVAPLTPAIVEDQQRVADTYFRLGLIPRAVRVADIVWSPA